MRFLLSTAAMLLCALCCGTAHSQSISLDHVDGLDNSGTYLQVGVLVTFHIRLTGDGNTHGGITNGFRVYSPDGATWNTTIGDTVGIGMTQFDGGFFITPFSVTGTGADTIGFGAFRFFSTGLPAYYDDVAYTIQVGPIPAADLGKTICLDSAYFPPSGVWKWAGPDVYPTWDGPHCFSGSNDPWIDISNPLHGAQWLPGTTQTISWSSSGDIGNVSIYYSSNSFVWDSTLVVAGVANNGSFNWTVPHFPTDHARIRIHSDAGVYETSDLFTIVGLVLTAPNGAEVITVGSNYLISWTRFGTVIDNVDLEYSLDNGPWILITTAPNTGIYSWNVPEVSTQNGRVRVSKAGDPSISDISDAVFTIAWPPCTIDVTSPAAGEIWMVGEAVDITWIAPCTCVVDLLFSYNNGIDWNPIASQQPNTEIYSWIVPDQVSSDCLIRVRCSDGSPDAVSSMFSIVPFSEPIERSVSLDHVDGVDVSGTRLQIDVPVIFYIRLTGDESTHSGITNGFRVYSPDGAWWNTTIGDTVGLGKTQFDGGFFIDPFSVTGLGADTLGFGGFRFFSTGLPVDYNDIAYTIQVGPITAANRGKTLCLDSTFYPPTGMWKWSGPDVYPSWDGPHCFTIGVGPSCGPFAYTPTAESGVFVGQATIDGEAAEAADCVAAFDADGNCAGAASIIVNAGTAYINLPIYGDDLLTPGTDEGMNPGESFTLVLYDASADAILPMNPDTAFGCWVNTNGTPLPGPCGDYQLVHDFWSTCDLPTITCPGVPFDVTACAGDEICVPLEITGATSVWVQGATWSNSQLCFAADVTGQYIFRVFASNDCGEVACDVTINVNITNPPIITCPDVPFDVTASTGDQVCVPLEITGAMNVSVEGATWVHDQLCFTVEGAGPVVYHVVATNNCGEAMCDVTVNVTLTDPPSIVSVDPNSATQCDGPLVVTIIGANTDWTMFQQGSITTLPDIFLMHESGSPTIAAYGVQVFSVTEVHATFNLVYETPVGLYDVTVDSPSAPPDVLVDGFTVNETQSGPAIITCPDVPFDVTACTGDEICVPLEITGAINVAVEGATWMAGQLCFTVNQSGVYQFLVIADNQCTDDLCVITINVTVSDPPIITCPDVPFDVTASTGDQVCVPLEITGAMNVSVEGATWANGQLCFTADASGPVIIPVVAVNDCGEVSCDVTVNVAITDLSDLVINSGNIGLLPTNPYPNEEVLVSAIVRNTGTVPASGFQVRAAVDRAMTYLIDGPIVVDGLAAGADTSVTFVWIADLAAESLFVLVDAEQVIQESSEGNNLAGIPVRVIEPGGLTITIDPQLKVMELRDTATFNLTVLNDTPDPHNLMLSVAGLEGLVWTLDADSIYLTSGDLRTGQLTVVSSPDCLGDTGTFGFSVIATSINDPVVETFAEAELLISPEPLIRDVLPEHGQTLASNSVTFLWKTDTEASTMVYYKPIEAAEYIAISGVAAMNHSVTLNDLDYGVAYLWYAESETPCGVATSEVRRFRTGRGVVFSSHSYSYVIRRNYNQYRTITVVNTDTTGHEVLVEAINPYDDLIVGFTDAGSVDEVLLLDPGEQAYLDFRMHAQDVVDTNYGIPLRLSSTAQDGSKVYDYAPANIHVRWPDTNFVLEDRGLDEYTLTRTMRLQNLGDTITDFRVAVEGMVGIDYFMVPQIEHALLGPGGFIDFDLIPTFLDTIVNKDRASCAATVMVFGAEKRIEHNLEDCCEESVFLVARANVQLCSYQSSSNWYCTNRPTIVTKVRAPAIRDGIVTSAIASVKFRPRTSTRAHTVKVYVNSHYVGRISGVVPNGTYEFDVDPSFINVSPTQHTVNRIKLVTSGHGSGHYTMGTDYSLCLCVDNYSEFVCAATEEEAQDKLDNRPYLYVGTPESVAIVDPEATDLSRRESHPVRVDVLPAHPKYDVVAVVDYDDGSTEDVWLTYSPISELYVGGWRPQQCGPATLTVSAQLCGPAVLDSRSFEVIDCNTDPPTIQVLDGAGDPISNREITLTKLHPAYRTLQKEDPRSAFNEADQILIVTDGDGKFVAPEFVMSEDFIKVALTIHEQELNILIKDHGHPAGMPNFYIIQVDNARITDNGEQLYYEVTGIPQQTLSLLHTTIQYELVVSVEWDATADYLLTLLQGMKYASNYMYDVTDGQAYIGRLLIADAKEYWDDCDIRVFAQNDRTPSNTPLAREYVRMPRQWYGNEETSRNRSYTGLDLTESNDYRTKVHELGHYLWAFEDEYEYYWWEPLNLPPPINDHFNIGFMDLQYEEAFDENQEPWASEMSNAERYDDSPTGYHSHTAQKILLGTCWEYFELLFEWLPYDHVSANIIRPGERFPSGDPQYLAGPNDDEADIDYNVGSLLDDSPIEDNYSDSKRIMLTVGHWNGSIWEGSPGVKVTTGRPGEHWWQSGDWLNQGHTGDSGEALGGIQCLGVRLGDVVKASGKSQTVTGSHWNSGQDTIDTDRSMLASSDSLTLDMLQLSPDINGLITATVNPDGPLRLSLYSTYDLSLALSADIPSDGEEPIAMSWDGISYEAILGLPASLEGVFVIEGTGDSGKPFFVDCPYLIASIDSSISSRFISAQNGCVIVVDSINPSNQRALILQSPFPTPLTGTDSGQYHIGSAISVDFSVSINLDGDINYLSIPFAEADLAQDLQTPGWKQGVRIYRWDETAEQWEYRGGVVDTASNTVTVQIDRGGVYAAFTAAPYTCEDISYMHPRGWSLVSTSVDVIDPDPDAVYGDDVPIYQLYGWNGSSYFSPTEIQSCGYGYWLLLLDSALIDYEGLCCQPQYGPVCIDLDPVWNIVGCPFITDVDWDLTTVDSGGVTLAFAEAVTRGWISSVKYGWNGTNYYFSQTLEPGKAYWMASLVSNLSLCVYPSDVYQPQPAAKPGTSPTRGDFVSLGLEGSDEFVFLGLSTDATNRFDPALDLPMPPTAPGSTNPVLSLVPQYESPFTSLVQDVQYPSDTVVWLLQLSGDQSMKLTASDLSVMDSLGYQLRVSEVGGGRFRMLDADHPLDITVGEHYVMAVRSMNKEAALPHKYYLSANYPNPFNPSTVIRFGLPRSSEIVLSIYNLLGQRVATLADSYYQAGHHELAWNGMSSQGAPVASGIYFYRLEAEEFTETKKMMLVK